MPKRYKSQEVEVNKIFVNEKIDGPNDCGVPTGNIENLKTCDINLSGHISGHVTGNFDKLMISGKKVNAVNEKYIYGFWFSGCNTENLYLDIGEKEEAGWDDHIHHGSGYRAYTVDFSGINVHITGRNESGLLTFEYPTI
jgi:hypothetical protein